MVVFDLDVCLGSLQVAGVSVPAVLSGDGEREERREDSVREKQLSGSEARGIPETLLTACSACSHFSK